MTSYLQDNDNNRVESQSLDELLECMPGKSHFTKKFRSYLAIAILIFLYLFLKKVPPPPQQR